MGGRPTRRRWRSARRAAWRASTPASNRWPSGWPGSRRSWTTSPLEIRDLADAVEHDPVALAALEERLGTIYALERRYGDGEAAVIAHGERAAAELERLRGLDDGARPARARGCRAAGRGRRRGRDPVGRPGARPATALAAAVGDGPARPRLPGRRLRGRARAAGGGRGRSPPSSSTATPSPSMRAASTRSSTASPRTRASRPARWPGSRRAASCRASRWRSRASWPRRTTRRSSSSTRSTRGSAAGARTRSAAACGPWRAATRSCA